MNDVLTEVRFWQQVIDYSKCTVICEPDLESRIKGWVDARSMGGIVSVLASPYCPRGKAFVIDTPLTPIQALPWR